MFDGVLYWLEMGTSKNWAYVLVVGWRRGIG
jgi:hypothetical protein